MKTIKTWETIHFYEGAATIELTLNHEEQRFLMTHGKNDNNVTFNGEISDFRIHTDRVKCVTAALNYAAFALHDNIPFGAKKITTNRKPK